MDKVITKLIDLSDKNIQSKYLSENMWEGFLNKEPITLTKNSVPIFDNATVWFELKTNQKINLGTHTFFIGEILDCKTLNPDERVAYMGDTRMKYGGVPRGGH